MGPGPSNVTESTSGGPSRLHTTCAESQTAWERRPVTNKNVHCSPFIIMLNQVNVHNILFAKDRELKVWWRFSH